MTETMMIRIVIETNCFWWSSIPCGYQEETTDIFIFSNYVTRTLSVGINMCKKTSLSTQIREVVIRQPGGGGVGLGV